MTQQLFNTAEATETEDVTRLTDEWIELVSVEGRFRRVTVRTADGDDEKVHTYLTTLSPETYDPLDVALIYAVRWLIVIMFRELLNELIVPGRSTEQSLLATLIQILESGI